MASSAEVIRDKMKFAEDKRLLQEESARDLEEETAPEEEPEES